MFQPDSRMSRSRLKQDSNRRNEVNDSTFSDNTENTREAVRQAQTETQHDQQPTYAGDAGTAGLGPESEISTADDHPADSLVDDDSAQSPSELYSDSTSLDDMSVVDKNRIGAGKGLDEAELGRLKPLDGKRWNGNPDEPLGG